MTKQYVCPSKGPRRFTLGYPATHPKPSTPRHVRTAAVVSMGVQDHHNAQGPRAEHLCRVRTVTAWALTTRGVIARVQGEYRLAP